MPRQESKGFLLRLDPKTMELVEKWAAQEFRSINGQLQWIVAESLRRHGRTPDPQRAKWSEENETQDDKEP